MNRSLHNHYPTTLIPSSYGDLQFTLLKKQNPLTRRLTHNTNQLNYFYHKALLWLVSPHLKFCPYIYFCECVLFMSWISWKTLDDRDTACLVGFCCCCLVLVLVFWWYWHLNSGTHACTTWATLPAPTLWLKFPMYFLYHTNSNVGKQERLWQVKCCYAPSCSFFDRIFNQWAI
jgi:hypothetical protein